MAIGTTIKVAPTIIVGGGRVGRSLQDLGNGDDVWLKEQSPSTAGVCQISAVIFPINADILSLSDSSSERQSPSAVGVRQISAVIFSIDVALAPPLVKYNKVKATPQRLARKTRQTKRKSLNGGADEGDENGFLF
ncbi:hypothetical protein RND71_028843 [Anisodus tanguticus]|uniref:Uncharacterized protein n=1 Tax=Anisodus tanguticus TaxID=243964 RepID=A0AAE1RKI4_9SOLA|nr:hypothetical protein RND71_028843 [Anisodus tanguticus]